MASVRHRATSDTGRRLARSPDLSNHARRRGGPGRSFASLSAQTTPGRRVRLAGGREDLKAEAYCFIPGPALTATIATVIPLNGVAMVAEGPIASTTATVFGKQSYCPASAHTSDYYTFEHYYPNMSPVNSESFWDCVINELTVNLPPTGLATIGFGILGLNQTNAATQALTSPTAATTSGLQAAVNGVLRSSSGALANITGIRINGTNGCEVAGPVVGSNVGVDVVKGRHRISGEITAFFDSITLRDYFLNETEVGLYVALTADSSATAGFVAFSMDRVKLGSATRSDGEGIKTVTLSFTALLNSSGGTGISTEATTLRIQDSAAP